MNYANKIFLNKLCFQCDTAMNFLVSQACEIRFHDIINQSTVHIYSYTKNFPKQNFQNMADLHGRTSMF